MMKMKLIIGIQLMVFWQNLFAQIETPIWDIGTKWTYEFRPVSNLVSYLTNEVTDTATIDNLKLYKVESYPVSSGIMYFYYDGNKVYNYNIGTKILQLLYDFDSMESYYTHYRPICDPSFNYDRLLYKEYNIVIDSTGQFKMPDGSFRYIQYVNPVDTIFWEFDTTVVSDKNRSILHGIGFLQGGLHHTHDWELGDYVCDLWSNYVQQLRCFESSNGTLYNFGNIPCDSTWIISSTTNFASGLDVQIYPNPTSGFIRISNVNESCEYEIFNMAGQKLQSGIMSNDGPIEMYNAGFQIIRIILQDKIIVKKLLKIE